MCNLEKESIDFLGRDFEQCFNQLRHYDSTIVDLSKFSFIAYTTFIGAAVSLYQISIDKNLNLEIPISIAFIISFLIGIFLYILVIRNRGYFVKVTRYINEQRNFFLQQNTFGPNSVNCLSRSIFDDMKALFFA